MASRGEKPGFFREHSYLSAGLLIFGALSCFQLSRVPHIDKEIVDALLKGPTTEPMFDATALPDQNPSSESGPTYPDCTDIVPDDTVSSAFERINESYYSGNTFRVKYSSQHGGGQKTFKAEYPKQIDQQGVVVWEGDIVCK